MYALDDTKAPLMLSIIKIYHFYLEYILDTSWKPYLNILI